MRHPGSEPAVAKTVLPCQAPYFAFPLLSPALGLGLLALLGLALLAVLLGLEVLLEQEPRQELGTGVLFGLSSRPGSC